MEKKSKEQLRVEEYFEENNIVHNGNYIYATRQERNLNSFWLLGLSGLLFKSAQPYYILFREDEILFFKMKVLGGIKELSFIMKVEDIKSIVLKKGLLSYSLIIKVETDGLINGKVENKGNSIEATISRKNVEDYVNSLKNSDEMQKNTAKNVEFSFKELDKKIAEGNANVSNFALGAAKLQKDSLSLSSSILDSLSGQIYASAQALTFQQSQTINKDLSNRLVMLGTLDNASDKFGLWISSIGANGKLKQNGYAEGKTKVYGGQVGIDKQFGENLILGTALAYSKGNVKFDRHGGKSDADNFGISLYGRVGNKDNPMYLQGRVGLGFVNSEVKRDIILSENDISRGKIEHNDKVISGYLETGYDVKKGDFVLTPFAGISHDTVQRGAFHEENSQFGLKADKKTYKQTSGLAGVRVSQKFNFENGSKTTLQGYITHQRAFNNEDLNFKASYSGLPDAKFKVKGIGLSKNQTWVGAGVLNEVSSKFAWYLNYDGKIDKKAKNNVFTAGMRVNF